MMKGGIAALSLFSKIIMTEYLTSTLVRRRRIRYSLLTVRRRRVRYSLFAFSEFLFRLNWPLFWPEEAAEPGTRNPEPGTLNPEPGTQNPEP
jgi:hypothetical protein